MGKIKRNIKRIFCIILLIVFSPIILIYLMVKGITKATRKRVWKKAGLNSRQLVLGTDITIIDKMEDFEADDYFKYLFFYDGFNAKKIYGKNRPNFILNKNNQLYTMKYNISKTQTIRQDVKILYGYNQKKQIQHGFYVTNKPVENSLYNEAMKLGIKIVDRDDLISLYTKTIARLKDGDNISQNYDAKPLSEQIDEMYPNRI